MMGTGKCPQGRCRKLGLWGEAHPMVKGWLPALEQAEAASGGSGGGLEKEMEQMGPTPLWL